MLNTTHVYPAAGATIPDDMHSREGWTGCSYQGCLSERGGGICDVSGTMVLERISQMPRRCRKLEEKLCFWAWENRDVAGDFAIGAGLKVCYFE